MNASELLLRAAKAGIVFWLEDGRLAYRAPKHAMTGELRAEIIRHKAALIAALGDSRFAPLPSLARHQDDGPVPLTSGQERLWLIERRLGPSPLYSLHFQLRWLGTLDFAALAMAVRDVVSRHPAMRMTFAESEGSVVATVSAQGAGELARLDLRDRPDPAAVAAEVIEEHQRTPFDLGHGPVLRTAVVTLADQHHIVLFTQHHIVTDGWSLHLLLPDLGRCYLARHLGRPLPAPTAEYSYADVARWEQRRRDQESYQESLRWWKQHLAGLSPLALGAPRRARAGAADHRGAVLDFTVPAGLPERLAALARAQDCTLYSVLLTAWSILLYRHTRQPDLAIGTVTSGRDRAEFQEVVGFFANTVVFRCDLSGNPSALEAIARVRAETETVFEHEIPFADIIMAVGAVPDAGLTPLIQAAFMFPDFEMATFIGSEEAAQVNAQVTVEARIDGSVEGTTKFDLMLTMQSTGDKLSGCLEYATERFSDAAAGRIAEHFLVLLESMTQDPGKRISQLQIMSQQERQQLLVEWNTRA